MSKASLREIDAALLGVTCVGITMSRRGSSLDWHPPHPVLDVACKAVMASCEIRYALPPANLRPASEALAQRGIQILNESERVLSRYAPDMVLSRGYNSVTGGTGAEVIEHIRDIRRREWTPDLERSFSNAVVSPSYLPEGVITVPGKRRGIGAAILEALHIRPKVA